MAYFGASSAAFGLVLSLMLVLIYYAKNLTVLQRIPKLLLLLIFVIMLHSAILHAQLHFLDSRAYISFFLFIFVISMAFFLSKVILIGGLDADQSFKYVFIVLFSLAISAYATEFKLGEIFYGSHKAIFPFGEPSHFALFFGPFFLLYLFQWTNIWKQIFVVLAVALLAIHIESTTLLIYVALALLLLVRINTVSLFLVVPVSIYGVYYVLNDPYFLSRIILSPDSDNLTALVYLQGLQDAHYSFISTNGIGLGFQMLGIQPMSIAGEQIATLMNGSTLNRQDGGFLAAKIIAEFGLLGVIFLLLYLYLLVKVFFEIKEAIKARYQFSYVYLFSLAFIYSSFVEFFVRGVGYFSPSFFLFLVAIFIYYHFKKNASAKFMR
jgi:hypothetical protein